MLFSKQSTWESHGYKFNPFLKFPPYEFVKIFSLENFIKKILNKKFDILQIIGGSGYGKSSQLTLLKQYLKIKKQKSLFYYIKSPQDIPKIPSPTPSYILMDECQRINKNIFLPYANKCKNQSIKTIIASHMDHQKWLNKNFIVKTIYLHQYTSSIIKNTWNKRLQYASIEKNQNIFTDKAIKTLCQLGNNSIEIARSLSYEIFTQQNIPLIIDHGQIIESYNKIKIKTHLNLATYHKEINYQ